MFCAVYKLIFLFGKLKKTMYNIEIEKILPNVTVAFQFIKTRKGVNIFIFNHFHDFSNF
jgi:hypothetical protein